MTPNPWKKLYGRAWNKARLAFLADNPLCAMCLTLRSAVKPATVVDHIAPHKGDLRLFWDRGNWQALCENCHNSTKQSQEKRDANAPEGCDANGYPTTGDW